MSDSLYTNTNVIISNELCNGFVTNDGEHILYLTFYREES